MSQKFTPGSRKRKPCFAIGFEAVKYCIYLRDATLVFLLSSCSERFYECAATATSNCCIGSATFFQAAIREIVPLIGDT